jgi:hypothetical protein
MRVQPPEFCNAVAFIAMSCTMDLSRDAFDEEILHGVERFGNLDLILGLNTQ